MGGERTMKRDCNIRSRYILYASPLFCDFISSKLIVSLSRIVSVEEKRERERESERIVVREILQHLFPPGNANQFRKCARDDNQIVPLFIRQTGFNTGCIESLPLPTKTNRKQH